MKIKKINKNLNIIKTRKYKDINIYLRFSIAYNMKAKASMAVLSKIMCDVSINYPNKTEMARKKDMLYGINCVTGYKTRGNILTYNINFAFINPKFLNTDINEYLDFIHEIINNALITDKNVNEAKRMIISNTLRRLDRPQSYASEKVIEIISKDNEDIDVYNYSDKFVKSIEEVNKEDVINIYKKLLNKAELDVYLCGDLSKSFINAFNFGFERRKEIRVKYKKINYPIRKRITETKPIGQSTLNMVFSTPYNRKSDDFYAYVMGNVFLGILPTSLLFEEVREKLGLCYSIGVIDMKKEGIVKVFTDIDSKNINIVIKQINKQIQRLINKDYDFTKLEMSKTLFINTLKSLDDDLQAFIEFDLESKLSNIEFTQKDYIDGIKKVSSEDISRVFKNYKPYFTYVLKGSGNEESL